MNDSKTLPPYAVNGSTYCTGLNGERICTGSQMGRRDVIPADTQAAIKLQLRRVPFIDYAYDQGGAYWGMPANLWCAWNTDCTLFFRCGSRGVAKATVRKTLPNARFYN